MMKDLCDTTCVSKNVVVGVREVFKNYRRTPMYGDTYTHQVRDQAPTKTMRFVIYTRLLPDCLPELPQSIISDTLEALDRSILSILGRVTEVLLVQGYIILSPLYLTHASPRSAPCISGVDLESHQTCRAT